MVNPVFGLSLLMMPEEGPKAIPASFDFSSIANYTYDQLGQLQDLGFIQYVQTLYVDNSDNTQILTIIEDLTGQRINIPARAQGYIPVLAPSSKPIFHFTTTPAPNLNVNVQFLNIPLQPELWGGQPSKKADDMVLLGEVTVTNAASLNVISRLDNSPIFNTDYDDYQIELIDLLNVTNNVNMYLRVTINGGATWEAGTNYFNNLLAGGGGVAVYNADNQPQMVLNYVPTTTIVNLRTPVRGNLYFKNPLSTAYYKTIHGFLSYEGDQLLLFCNPNAIYKQAANAVNGFQLICSAGNISGTVRVYGLTK